MPFASLGLPSWAMPREGELAAIGDDEALPTIWARPPLYRRPPSPTCSEVDSEEEFEDAYSHFPSQPRWADLVDSDDEPVVSQSWRWADVEVDCDTGADGSSTADAVTAGLGFAMDIVCPEQGSACSVALTETEEARMSLLDDAEQMAEAPWLEEEKEEPRQLARAESQPTCGMNVAASRVCANSQRSDPVVVESIRARAYVQSLLPTRPPIAAKYRRLTRFLRKDMHANRHGRRNDGRRPEKDAWHA